MQDTVSIPIRRPLARGLGGKVCAVLMVFLGVLLSSTDISYGQERLTHPLGEFEYQPTTNGILICAPHGSYDVRTDEIAIAASRRLGAGYVVARGFTVRGKRINVNRPSEGAGRLYSAQEPRTKRAREVFETYSELVKKASGGQPLRLYVEVHGNTNPFIAHHIEIASKGITRDEALRLKEAFPAMIHKVRATSPTYPDLKISAEPVDRITYQAGGVKSFGIMAGSPALRGLHIELPRSVRRNETCAATAVLIAAIVTQIVGDEGTFVPGRDQRERPTFRRAQ